MARTRSDANMNPATANMLDSLTAAATQAPLDERVALLQRIREAAQDSASAIDHYLVERILRQDDTLNQVREAQAEQQEKVRELIQRLTEPPLYPAVYLGPAYTDEPDWVLVQADNDRRVVRLGEKVRMEDLTQGDEVFLSHERNLVLAKPSRPSQLTGEVAAFSRVLSDGRLLLRSRDEELVVLANSALREENLKAGDNVRFNRMASLAFERVERAQGDRIFLSLESTPNVTFADLGGLDKEIEQLKRMITMHKLHPEKTNLYQLPPKRSVLMVGPPGCGKTALAKATANWMGAMSNGRARFANVKPGALLSKWYGEAEANIRELFTLAREAAAAEPQTPIILFLDEIDSLAGIRGQQAHKVDDKILNAFMAELDGLESRGAGVLVMSATNRMDTMDPAVLRGGRVADMLLEIGRPNRAGAQAILSCKLSANIPYAENGEGAAAARESMIERAVAQLFAENGDNVLANVTLRSGKRVPLQARQLLSGAALESICQAAVERAVVRDLEGGQPGVSAADLDAAIFDYLVNAPKALTPANVCSYVSDLPHDADPVNVELVTRRVRPHLYRREAA